MNKYIIKPEDTLRINRKRVVTHFYLILKKPKTYFKLKAGGIRIEIN